MPILEMGLFLYHNMQVNEILSLSKTLTYSNDAQLPNATLIPFANLIYQDFCRDIRATHENYFYKTYFFDTVPYQNKYDLVTQTGSVFGLQKVISIGVKYKQSGYDTFSAAATYTKGDKVNQLGRDYIAKQDITVPGAFNAAEWQQIFTGYLYANEIAVDGKQIDSLNRGSNGWVDFETLNEVGYTQNPKYFMGQNTASNTQSQSLYIYPYISDTVLDGIKVEGISSTIDLVVGGAENTILIERNYHETLVQGLMAYIYQSQGKVNEAMNQWEVYRSFKENAISDISNRSYSRNYFTDPDLSYLE